MRIMTVALRNKNGKFIVPKFSDCFLRFFGEDINSVTVNCSVENGIFVLNECEEGYELRHSPKCPFKLRAESSDASAENQRNENTRPARIALAASIAVESSDSHILLTRRTAHMRASPNSWVLPGGHIEFGETALDAARRETKEETALDISSESASILGFWEYVYPISLGAGEPKYHTLVVYLHTRLNECYSEITKRIIPNTDEVDAYCWLSSTTLSNLFNREGNTKCDGKQYVLEDGKLVEKNLDCTSLFNRFLRSQPEPYSGVNFALRKWMKQVHSKQPKSKY